MPKSHTRKNKRPLVTYHEVDVIKEVQTKVGMVRTRTDQKRMMSSGLIPRAQPHRKTDLEKEAFQAWKLEPRPRPSRGPWITNYVITHTPTPHGQPTKD